jgi:hypothetical protein
MGFIFGEAFFALDQGRVKLTINQSTLPGAARFPVDLATAGATRQMVSPDLR